jgi:hypothetical protein
MMEKGNLIENGNFASGMLEPWVTGGKGVEVYQEGSRPYVRIPASHYIRQDPQVPTGLSVLEFQARTREPLNEDQSILFIAALLFQLTDGSLSLLTLAGAVTQGEWQTFTFKIPKHDAVVLTLQVTPLGVTDFSGLSKVKNLLVGTVEFRFFSLSPGV